MNNHHGGRGVAFLNMCKDAARQRSRSVLEEGAREVKKVIKGELRNFDSAFEISADFRAALHECLLSFFSTPGTKTVSKPTAEAMLLKQPLDLTHLGFLAAQVPAPVERIVNLAAVTPLPVPTPVSRPVLEAPESVGLLDRTRGAQITRTATLVSQLGPSNTVPSTPPAAQQRTPPTIQPRSMREILLPLTDPTGIWRDQTDVAYPWFGNPRAGFTVPVVLHDGAQFLFRRIVAIIVYNNDTVGHDTFVELEWDPSLIPLEGVPHTALAHVVERTVRFVTEPIIELGGSANFDVDGVFEIVRTPMHQYALVKWSNTVEPLANVPPADVDRFLEDIDRAHTRRN